jgi:hypothetical protein
MLLSSAAIADDLTVRIGEDALSLMFDPVATEKNSVSFAFIHNDDEDTDLLSLGFFANGSKEHFDGRLGGKIYYADLNKGSGYGAALGGEMWLPLLPDLKLNAGLYYGPSSLSFSDVDKYQEWFLRLNYQVFENAKLGAGVGSLELEPDSGSDVEVEDGVFFEMSLSF